jgi:hypothetical protein
MLGEPLLLLDATGRRVFWTPMGGEITAHTIRSVGIVRKFYETSFARRVNDRGVLGWELTRPYHKEEGYFFELIDEVHNWIMVEQGFARYVIDYRWLDGGVAWAVGFPNENEAVAYKLRWLDC